MKFDSEKGMDNIYTRLVAFRSFVRLMAISEYSLTNHLPRENDLRLLDELISNLAKHNDKVFNKDFIAENCDMEKVLEPIPKMDSEDDDEIPF